MIRGASVQINYGILSRCRLVAQEDGLDCAETLIELWLGERLAQRPEILDLDKRIEKAVREVKATWKAEQADKREQLP